MPIESESAAPHEIMSAIIGLSKFGDIIGDEESKELFARCITGYAYKESSKENEIKNCFICMLNSRVIDVDRLDYLIRDAYTSGFATISIDYMRLLEALTIVQDENNKYKIAYHKDAVSVIENVVYAHDAERKWIQNHPVVLYESYILKHILEHLNLNEKLNKNNSKKLFSEKSLSKEGHKLKAGIKVSLMCDDDVIYLSKNKFSDELSEEFFERKKRRHPVWKSEAEYRAYIEQISTGGKIKDRFMECMQSFNESKVPDHPVPLIINESLIEKLEKDLEDAKILHSQDKNIQAIKCKLSMCNFLRDYVYKRNLPFDFIIIQTSMFNSNFSKIDLGKVPIAFGKGKEDRVEKLSDVCKLLKSDSGDKDFYYLFYRRTEETKEYSGKIDDIVGFCNEIYNTVINS